MKHTQGFSLIEMAFVLVIITLLLGGLLVPFATQVEQRRITETQKSLEEIKEALIGYALSHGTSGTPSLPYLPCPDFDGDGLEDRNADGSCASNGIRGSVPWATLGIAPTDAWGNRFLYVVDPGPPSGTNPNPGVSFTDKSRGFNLNATGRLAVCTHVTSINITATSCPSGTTLAENLPAVVLSYGKNGYGALNSNGKFNQPPTSVDEVENTSASSVFLYVSRAITPVGAPIGEFDDIVTWVSPNILFNRMVSAGKLP